MKTTLDSMTSLVDSLKYIELQTYVDDTEELFPKGKIYIKCNMCSQQSNFPVGNTLQQLMNEVEAHNKFCHIR